MDWGSIAQIGAAVLPAIFGGGSSGSAPSTGGGTNWGAILAALGSQAAKIKATPLAGADESDIRKANRINLLTGLLGGGVSALGTSMVQQRQAAADAKALKILSGLETTTGQPIVPGGSTGTEPVGATPTVTTGDGQDILGLGSIASQYGELSPTMQKRVMDYAKEQQKQFQKAIAPMSPQEAAAIGSIAAQLSPVEESRPMYAEQLERRFQQQKASQLPFGLRQRAEEITSQRPPVIGSLFGQQPPQTEGITPATTPTVTMERRPTALVEEFPQVSELPAEVQTEFNQAMDVLGGRRQQTTPTLRGEEPPTPTPRAPAPTPSPTPTATPFPAQVEVEQLSAKKAALENDVVALQRVIQDPRVPEQQRQRAPAALAVAREELKMITENLDRSSRAFEKQQSGAREEERIGLTRAQQERQEKRGQRDFNFEIDKQAGAIQDKNGQPLIDQVRMLQNTLNFSELDRFGQNNALINLRRQNSRCRGIAEHGLSNNRPVNCRYSWPLSPRFHALRRLTRAHYRPIRHATSKIA